MAPHSSTLAWKIPWTEEPGRLQSMGSRRVGHNCVTSLSLFTFMQWRRKWQPTPVFLPGESQGRGSLVGCCLWGHTESDMTEVTQQQQQQHKSVKESSSIYYYYVLYNMTLAHSYYSYFNSSSLYLFKIWPFRFYLPLLSVQSPLKYTQKFGFSGVSSAGLIL